MELSGVTMRVEADEEVKAEYLPARVERLSDGFEMDYPEWLGLRLGGVLIAGRPVVVGRAARPGAP